MFKTELTNKKPLLMQGLFLFIISFFAVQLSLPALSGGFILDDWPNLAYLDDAKQTNGFWRFVLTGISSQLGRPISLFSFAVQAEHWPHNPYPFKLTGLCLHIINALLAYLCSYQIARLRSWTQRYCFLFAGTVFILWLFLPLNISTTFYVVQRMVLLAALFSLIGITLFLWGFRLSIENKKRQGLTVATLGLVITYILGILSKENAILTGLGIAILYWGLLRPIHPASYWDKWILILGVLPSLLIFVYLCFHLNQHTRPDFTPYERLLTESVILIDYVDKIFFPTPFKLNIFNDGFPTYKSLLEPTVTKAVLFWFTLTTFAIVFRKTAPFFAFGVLWFLSGHLLESTILGLELYFEHRNYLPSLGILIGFVGTLFDLIYKLSLRNDHQQLQKLNYAATIVLSALTFWYIVVYGVEVNSWRNPGTMAIAAVIERPNSPRAHQEAASFYANVGDINSSRIILDKIEHRWPSTGNFAQYQMLKCLDENTLIPQKRVIQQRLQNGKFDRGTLPAFTEIYTLKKQGNCKYLSWQEYLDDIEVIYNNPQFSSQVDDFLILQAYAYTALKEPMKAALTLDRIPNESADTDYLLYKAQFFAVAGEFEKALSIVKFTKEKYANNVKFKLTNETMVDSMALMLRKALENKTK